MQLRKRFQKRIREAREDVSLAGDVNVAVAGNVGEKNAVTHVSSRQDAEAADPEAETEADEVGGGMSERDEQLTEEDVEAAQAEPLPDREAMTVMKPPLPYEEIEPLPPVYTIDPPPSETA